MNANDFLSNPAVQSSLSVAAATSPEAQTKQAIPAEREIRNLYRFERIAKLKPHSVIITKRFSSGIEKQTQTNANSLVNLEKGAAAQWNGYLSPATRRRVKGIIENYLTALQLNCSMEFPKSFPSEQVYPTFLTLTLPAHQHHCDNEIKEKCFLRFVEYLTGSKEKGASGWGVKNYIWAAETQKNGNIHFHLILDRALPADRINRVWNQFLNRLGYVDRFRNTQNYIYERGFYVRKDMLKDRLDQKREAMRKTGQKFDSKEARKEEAKRQKEAYERGIAANWSNPPSTKIHAIRSIRKLTAYISKYMTKAPKIVSVPLEPGQKLVEENGKFYIETTTVERGIGYEIETQKGGMVQAKEIVTETVHTDRQAITVSFENRRLRGRIWGCSRALHTENLNPWTLSLESVSINQITSFETHTRKVRSGVYTENLFGEREFVGMQNRTETMEVPRYERKTENPVFDPEAVQYIDFLTGGYVPEKDIKEATAKAGEMFAHYGGQVIPLEHPQKDVLYSFFPSLHARYCDYYREMFLTLYPESLN